MSKYFDRLTEMANKQIQKGLSKYGTTLEENNKNVVDRLTYIQEELIDAFFYCEWVKDSLSSNILNDDFEDYNVE